MNDKLRLPPPPPEPPGPVSWFWDVAIGREKGKKRAPQEYDDVSDNAVFTELTRKDSGKQLGRSESWPRLRVVLVRWDGERGSHREPLGAAHLQQSAFR